MIQKLCHDVPYICSCESFANCGRQLFVRGLQIATDVVGLVDEWAARFFEELDYINEGENATRFAEQMRVDLPQVSSSLSSRFVTMIE